MEWLLSSELKPNIVQFNEFFNCLAHAHLPEKCVYYLKIMLEKCQIRPDLILLNTLIKGCRFQARHDFALIYWEMITCYGLVPNEICYTEMISVCARSHHKEHADQLFAEYLEKVENDILPASLATFSAYLHVFSSLGDIGGMEYVLNIIQDYRFKYDAIIVGMMMDTYYNARDGRKALDVCDKYVDGHLIKFNPTLITLKCLALYALLTHDERVMNNFETKQTIYSQLVQTIYEDINGYKLQMNSYIISIQLSAAIALYHDVNPMKIVELFETLVNDRWIGYMKGNTAIDLHLFTKTQAQFVLRYLIGFKLKDIMAVTKNRQIIIITGKGKGTEGDGNLQHSLKRFIEDELLTYQPTINCMSSNKENDSGILIVKKSTLLLHLQIDPNYAKQKLLTPSKDWYWDDP
eukprot:60024_1